MLQGVAGTAGEQDGPNLPLIMRCWAQLNFQREHFCPFLCVCVCFIFLCVFYFLPESSSTDPKKSLRQTICFLAHVFTYLVNLSKEENFQRLTFYHRHNWLPPRPAAVFSPTTVQLLIHIERDTHLTPKGVG